MIELDICGLLMPVSDSVVGDHALPFQKLTAPGVPSPCGNPNKVAVPYLVDAATNEPAGGARTHYGSQLTLLRERGNPLAGACCALIHQKGDSAVERLCAETLGNDAHGIIAKSELESEPDQGRFLRWNAVEDR